eukprot:TRINITY_DN4811_c0_g1_i1.p1 TRINITY_DN4811_c0_g1~~TRINITY_DN4811_c0_g1_i1.p1  ORF type:complete len:416 (-),score=48.60 TRINITY_DN4811_c0_g1_i1:459-1706(-)
MDLRAVNQQLGRPPRFRLPTPADLDEFLLGGRWTHGVILDFRGWFHQFKLAPEVAENFLFRTKDGGWYRWNRLPMGCSHSPYVAQMGAETILGTLPGRVWLDDVVVVGSSAEDCAAHRDEFVARARQAGAELHPRKCVLDPRAVVQYAGVQWDLATRRKRLPAEWRAKAIVRISALLKRSDMSVRDAWGAVGMVAWYHHALRLPLCVRGELLAWVRRVSRWAGPAGWEKMTSWSQAVRADLRTFLQDLEDDTWRDPRPTTPEECDVAVWTDASEWGWGAMTQWRQEATGVRRWGQWRPTQLGHMFVLEARAAIAAVRAAVRNGAKAPLLMTDNAGVRASLAKGHCALRLVNALMADLYKELTAAGAVLRVEWISTSVNPSDGLSRRRDSGCTLGFTSQVGIDPTDDGFLFVPPMP